MELKIRTISKSNGYVNVKRITSPLPNPQKKIGAKSYFFWSKQALKEGFLFFLKKMYYHQYYYCF